MSVLLHRAWAVVSNPLSFVSLVGTIAVRLEILKSNLQDKETLCFVYLSSYYEQVIADRVSCNMQGAFQTFS